MPAAPLSLTTADVQAAGAAPLPPGTPDAAAPAEPPTEPTEPSAGEPRLEMHPAALLETLPSELLDNPLIFQVAKGSPAAVSAPDKSKDPAVLAVVKHAQPLVAAGFGIYHSIDKKTDVLFNTQAMHPGDLQEADQQGRLLEVAPPFDSVKTNSPATSAGNVPGGAGASAPIAGAQLPPATPPPMSQPAPSVQNKLAQSRVKNLTPMGPTGGPAPGAGNILNSILKRPV